MDFVVTVWLSITAILGILATLAIWSRGLTKARGWAVAAFLFASPIAAVALGFSLGWPVPLVQGVTVSAGKPVILGAKMIVGVGIFILVDRGEFAPRYVVIPWDEKLATELQKAIDESGKDGTTRMEVKPWEWSWDRHPPQFHPDPQPRVLPPKIQQEEEPERFEHDV